MDWSQILYLALLVLAIYTGQPNPLIAFAMIFDLVGTMLFAADPFSVAIIDLVAVILLAGEGRRANAIAALFVLAQPVYFLHAFGLNNAAIYTIVDCIAYLQLFILGRGDVGLARACRYLGSRRRGGNRSVVFRGDAPLDLNPNQGVVRGTGVSGGKG